jgi:acid phosphatase
LYPDKVEGKKSKKNKKNKKPKGGAKYKVWTASSDRDIQTAEAYIKGSFPSHQSGPDGHGDGTVVQLVKVPNKAAEWDRSLTPHVRSHAAVRIITD